MDHDVKSLQVLIEGEFKALHALQQQMHVENRASAAELRADLVAVKEQTTATNGRLVKAEVAIAVLRFAVLTIGGSLLGALLFAAIQVVVSRFAVGQ